MNETDVKLEAYRQVVKSLEGRMEDCRAELAVSREQIGALQRLAEIQRRRIMELLTFYGETDVHHYRGKI